jgi:hypothetical protein
MVEEQGKFTDLTLGIDAESEDDLHQTVLYYVAREGKTKCIDYLINHGCRADHVDLYRQTPLYYAVRENRIDTAKKLISVFGPSNEERKHKINHVDAEGENVLFYAINEGHYEMAVLLVENGVDYNLENKDRFTCLDICKRKKHYKIEQYLLSLGAKKGVQKKMKKRSGRPASLHTLKTYVFCVFKDGKWVEATGETSEELKVFESLKDHKLVNEYMEKITLPKNLPANIQWEKSAQKILISLKKEAEFDFFCNFKNQLKDFEISWDLIHKYPDFNKQPITMTIIKNKLDNNEYFCLQDW